MLLRGLVGWCSQSNTAYSCAVLSFRNLAVGQRVQAHQAELASSVGPARCLLLHNWPAHCCSLCSWQVQQATA